MPCVFTLSKYDVECFKVHITEGLENRIFIKSVGFQYDKAVGRPLNVTRFF